MTESVIFNSHIAKRNLVMSLVGVPCHMPGISLLPTYVPCLYVPCHMPESEPHATKKGVTPDFTPRQNGRIAGKEFLSK